MLTCPSCAGFTATFTLKYISHLSSLLPFLVISVNLWRRAEIKKKGGWGVCLPDERSWVSATTSTRWASLTVLLNGMYLNPLPQSLWTNASDKWWNAKYGHEAYSSFLPGTTLQRNECSERIDTHAERWGMEEERWRDGGKEGKQKRTRDDGERLRKRWREREMGK